MAAKEKVITTDTSGVPGGAHPNLSSDSQGSSRIDLFAPVVIGIFAGTLMLAAWLVVGVGLYVLYRNAIGQGIGEFGAAALAVPITFLPAWKSWLALRSGQGMIGVLKGHLWVLNGAVGYSIVVLALLAIRDVALHTDQSSTSSAIVAGAAGFVLLSLVLLGFNFWLFRYVGRAADRAQPQATGAMNPLSQEAESQ